MDYLEKIKEAIKGSPARGSVTEAARMMGVSKAYVSDMLLGKRKISVAMSVKLEDCFQLNGLEILEAQLAAEREEYLKNN